MNTEEDEFRRIQAEVQRRAAQQSEQYDQTALELCNVCGWKTVIPEDCCLNCARDRHTTSQTQRPWVGLTDDEREEIALEIPIDAVYITEAKLKEKNV